MSSESTHSFPPPSSNVINLAYVEIVLSAIFIPLIGFIAWKHGKAGLTCWQIFITAFIAKLIANIYLIVRRDEPYLPNSVSTTTDAAVVATTSLAIIGIIYEAWTDKIILGATHLANTVGIAAATYGGAPSATGRGGVADQGLSRAGTLLMLGVLLAACGWMWPTRNKILSVSRHPNARAARSLLRGGAAAMPAWLGRLGYMCVYAFDRQDASLDPVVGSFAVRMLLFGTLWGAAAALAAGGWASLAHMPAGGVPRGPGGRELCRC